MKRFAALVVFALWAVLGSESWAQTRYPLSGLFYSDGPGQGIDASGAVNGQPGLVGRVPYGNLPAVVKSITTAGLATVQLADGTEASVQLAGLTGGGNWSSGTADPTGGSAGDGYLQVDASDVLQSIWLNVSGTWTEYTLPTTGGAGDITSITTPTGSGIGLTGCDTGDCTVVLDIAGMTSVGLNLLTSGDEIILRENGLDRRTTLGNVAAYTFGLIVDQTDLTALADADSFVVNDASEGADDPREVAASLVSNYIGSRLAGAGLTYNTTTNQLDGAGGPQIELIDSLNDVTYDTTDTTDLSTRFGGGVTVYTADLDAEGTADAEINDLFVFQWRDNPAALPDDRQLGIRINGSTALPIRVVDPIDLSLTNKLVGDLTRYEFLFLSRQDGVFIQLSALSLSQLMEKLLPTATDDQVARYDSSTSAWVAEALTFLAGSDTPTDYTGAARDLARVNATENGIEFVPEPSNANTIPHVGRIPAATADSPLLIILTNNQRDGDREDVTLTVAADASNQYCGYSDGEVFPAFGALTGESPVAAIFGIWNTTDNNCDLANIYSFNEGFIDDATRIVGSVGGTAFTCDLGVRYQEHGYSTKRITSCGALEDLATGDIPINLLDADGDAYWLDGDVIHSPGLYVKLEVNGQLVYHDVTPPEDAHKTGSGSAACGPTNPPTAPGQICVADGRGYFAMLRQSITTTDPEVTSVSPPGNTYFYPGFGAEYVESDPNVEDGEFVWLSESQDFYQLQGATQVFVTWEEAWTYVVDNVDGQALHVRFRDGTFLGEFASEIELARDRDGYDTGITATGEAEVSGGAVTSITITHVGHGYTTAPTITIAAPPGGGNTQATATATITDGRVTAVTITEGGTGYTTAPTVTFSDAPNLEDYFFIYTDFFTLLEITGFDHSQEETADEGLAWRGPVIISEEVLEIVEANPEGDIDKALDALQVGSQTYSVIVRPGSNGHLRTPTAADFSNHVVGFDGRWREVGRRFATGHTASADDSIRADGTTTTYDGRTWRYRDEHHGDGNVHNAQSLDYYYDLRSLRFRWCFSTAPPPAACRWAEMHTDSGHFDGEFYQSFNFLGYFTSRDDALAAATASGQSAIYERSGGWDFNTFGNLVTAQPDEYRYDWRDVMPPVPADPGNAVLVDNETYTWTAANRPGQEVHFSRALTAADDGRPVLIDYRPNAAGSDNRAAGAVILSEHIRHLTTLRPMMLQKTAGGDTPIDHTIDLPTSRPGSIEFPFPISSGGNERRWMRMYYIGDHVDDLDGSFGTGTGTTTLTLDSTTGITTDTDYWISGPVEGGGCTLTRHDEKVTVTAIGTPNADDITVIRGVDGTTISDDDCDTFASGADFIEDNKTTFVLAATHDDQDSGDFTFTLLARGVGASGSGGGGAPDVTTIYDGITTDADDDEWHRFDFSANIPSGYSSEDMLRVILTNDNGLQVHEWPMFLWDGLTAIDPTDGTATPAPTGTTALLWHFNQDNPGQVFHAGSCAFYLAKIDADTAAWGVGAVEHCEPSNIRLDVVQP